MSYHERELIEDLKQELRNLQDEHSQLRREYDKLDEKCERLQDGYSDLLASARRVKIETDDAMAAVALGHAINYAENLREETNVRIDEQPRP